MTDAVRFPQYKAILLALDNVVSESEKRVQLEPADALFGDNVNLFVKAYLVSLCSYLEAFLIDLAFDYAEGLRAQISSLNIPHNFIHWGLGQRAKQQRFQALTIKFSRRDVSDLLSPNPYRTAQAFAQLGIDLTASPNFQAERELVETIVRKRNDIIHHNDSASDVSFSDVRQYIQTTIAYMQIVSDAVTPEIATRTD